MSYRWFGSSLARISFLSAFSVSTCLLWPFETLSLMSASLSILTGLSTWYFYSCAALLIAFSVSQASYLSERDSENLGIFRACLYFLDSMSDGAKFEMLEILWLYLSSINRLSLSFSSWLIRVDMLTISKLHISSSSTPGIPSSWFSGTIASDSP